MCCEFYITYLLKKTLSECDKSIEVRALILLRIERTLREGINNLLLEISAILNISKIKDLN